MKLCALCLSGRVFALERASHQVHQLVLAGNSSSLLLASNLIGSFGRSAILLRSSLVQFEVGSKISSKLSLPSCCCLANSSTSKNLSLLGNFSQVGSNNLEQLSFSWGEFCFPLEIQIKLLLLLSFSVSLATFWLHSSLSPNSSLNRSWSELNWETRLVFCLFRVRTGEFSNSDKQFNWQPNTRTEPNRTELNTFSDKLLSAKFDYATQVAL